jgi:hypothetical protein
LRITAECHRSSGVEPPPKERKDVLGLQLSPKSADDVVGAYVSFSARRAKHFGLSEIARDVQPFAQKYLSFRKAEIVL